MSNRPTENAPSAGSIKDGNETGSSHSPMVPTSSGQKRPLAALSHRAVSSPIKASPSPQGGRGFDLPSLPSVTNGPSGRFSPPASRLAGVSSILNPLSNNEPPPDRHRQLPPRRVADPEQQILPPIVTPTPGRPADPRTSSPSAPERPPRRILTPRSPSLHRAASLSHLNSANGPAPAQQQQFATSPEPRAYAIQPGTAGVPPLPTTSTLSQPRADYGFGGAGPGPATESFRRASTGAARLSAGHSVAGSPAAAYSTFKQADPNSPSDDYSIGPSAIGLSHMGDPSLSGFGTLAASERQRPAGIPISSSGGQNVYQMMTLETADGSVQLPVDVQAASRAADEKRRRNAGASARFRQRRKEKEKEASTTISRLEHQIKETEELMEFYRRDRELLMAWLRSTPNGDRYFPRPISPRLSRTAPAPMRTRSLSGGPRYSPSDDQERDSEDSRNVRRRTSHYNLPHQSVSHEPSAINTPHISNPPPGLIQIANPAVATTNSHLPQPHESSWSRHHSASNSHDPLRHPPQSRASLPDPTQLYRGPQGPETIHAKPMPTNIPHVLHASPQTGPWNPYSHSQRQPPGPTDRSR